MMNDSQHRESQRGSEAAAQPHLIFNLSNSTYAISANQVREIITTVTLTPVPGAPSYLAGVTNLRGHIIPIIDLRKRFDLAPPTKNFRPCFIILMMETDDTIIEFGIAVDQVMEVLKLQPTELDTAPAMHDIADQLIFDRVAKTDSGIKLILDTGSLLRQLKSDIGANCRFQSVVPTLV